MGAATIVSPSTIRLDGDDLRGMFSSAAALLERNVESLNALNVFPVPDGDTGTNMYLTIREVVEKAEPMQGASAGEVATAMARAALTGARGNSGVILSQVFKGIAVGLYGTADFAAEELVSAFQQARLHAYRAVNNPVEGTILTVIASVAEASQRALGPDANVHDILDEACAAARESVARTPTMLVVLREAGVVDAGGQGLSIILEGLRRYAKGEKLDVEEIAAPEPVGVDAATGAVSRDFLVAAEEEMYGYCTQFLIDGSGLDVDAIRESMSALAHSTVVVGDETMVNVHVHTEDPGPVVSLGVAGGTLSQVKIVNMDDQHIDFSEARRKDASDAAVAVVVVAWGVGLEVLFTSLGASGIVAGGDTMNPSVQETVRAVEAAPSDNVVILPNNSNIVPAAIQAADYSEKAVRVVPTKSIPQGIAAILAFDPERELQANLEEMEKAAASVQSGEVTEAVRAVTLNGVTVRPGRLIGLLERELVAVGDSPAEVVLAVLGKADVSEGSLVTLYWGASLTEEDAGKVAQEVSTAFPGVEVELVSGGQPHYHLIVSIE